MISAPALWLVPSICQREMRGSQSWLAKINGFYHSCYCSSVMPLSFQMIWAEYKHAFHDNLCQPIRNCTETWFYYYVAIIPTQMTHCWKKVVRSVEPVEKYQPAQQLYAALSLFPHHFSSPDHKNSVWLSLTALINSPYNTAEAECTLPAQHEVSSSWWVKSSI